jgi:hypothetical protein
MPLVGAELFRADEGIGGREGANIVMLIVPQNRQAIVRDRRE